MKTLRLTVAFFGIVLFMLAITPPAIAGQDPIDGMWWQGKLTFKGYQYTTDAGNTLGDQTSGSVKVWIHTRYLTDTSEYEALTCGITSPYDPDNYGWQVGIINRNEIYNSNQNTQMWNWDNNEMGLLFSAIPYDITIYPVLLVKIKPPTQASLSTVSCTAYTYDAARETYILGPCTLKAKSIDPGKASTTVPQACLDRMS